jgi:hypothetical protein
MLLMAHIPKCGGTSFRNGLKEAYGDTLQLYENNPLETFWRTPLRRKLGAIARYFRGVRVKKDCEIIYGHFCFDQFSKINFNTAIKRGAFFRDPVEWVGSLLIYRQRKHPDFMLGDHQLDIKRMNLCHGFKKFLGEIRIDDLDFVGIKEDYDNSLELFKNVFGKAIPRLVKNKTVGAPESYRDYFLKQGILSEVEELMSENIATYKLAVERYHSLCATHNLQPKTSLHC